MRTGLILCLLAVLWAAAPLLPSKNAETAHPEVPRISAEELKILMDEKADYVLVDVRDRAGYDSGHIEGAENIHFDVAADPMDRSMMLMALPMETLIILYCA